MEFNQIFGLARLFPPPTPSGFWISLPSNLLPLHSSMDTRLSNFCLFVFIATRNKKCTKCFLYGLWSASVGLQITKSFRAEVFYKIRSPDKIFFLFQRKRMQRITSAIKNIRGFLLYTCIQPPKGITALLDLQVIFKKISQEDDYCENFKRIRNKIAKCVWESCLGVCPSNPSDRGPGIQ